MIKSELRQASAPPLQNYKNQFIQQQLNKSDKRTIEFGPWNSQTEKENEYLEDELSLSKYNTGFCIQNQKNSKNKNIKKHKKRSISQLSHRQTSKTLNDESIQLQRNDEEYFEIDYEKKLEKIGKENNQENSTFEKKTEYQSNVDYNKQLRYKNENESILAKSMFLSSLKKNQNLLKSTNIKQSQGNLTNIIEQMCYRTKTEPSQAPSYLDKSKNIFKNPQKQINSKIKMRVTQHSTFNKRNQYHINFSPQMPIRSRNSQQEYSQIYQDINNDNLNIQRNDQIQQYISQKKDKCSTLSNNIDNNAAYKIIKSSISSPSSYSSNLYQNNQVIPLNNPNPQIKQIQENNQPQKIQKHFNSSMKSTPLQNSPNRMGNLFQISANRYYQERKPKNIAKEFQIEDNKQKNDLKQQQYQTKEQYLNQTHNIFSSNQNHNFPQNQATVGNNIFFTSFSKIVPTQTNENQEKLHLTQNHLRVSHYQTQYFKKNQSNEQQSQCIQNNKISGSILKEISMTANNNSNVVNKQFNSSGLKFESFDLTNTQTSNNYNNNNSQKRKSLFIQNGISTNNNDTQQTDLQSFIIKSKNSFNQIYSNSNNLNQQNGTNFYHQTETLNNQIQNNQYNPHLFNENNINSSYLLNQNKQDVSEENASTAIYRKASCTRNQLNFKNIISASIPINQNKIINENTSENSKSVFIVPKNSKISEQFYPKNNKIRRRSCSPVGTFGQQENTRYIKRIIMETNLEKCKNLEELNQSVQIIKSQANNNNNYNSHLPKLNTCNQSYKY